MWLITLLVLAVIAYFLVKFLTGKASKQDSSASQTQVLENTIPSAADSASSAKAALSSSTSSQNQDSPLPDLGVDTGNLQNDVQEMIKILNLAPSDAARISLSRDAFSALKAGDAANAPSADELTLAAAKLRKMLA